MKSLPNPFDLWIAQFELMKLTYEVQMVVSMRVLGMAGLWSVAPSENKRMVTEKMDAFTKAAAAVGAATMRGARPDQVVMAAVTPLRAKTKSNTKRLARRGPRLN